MKQERNSDPDSPRRQSRDHDARALLALRIGVTGARSLAADQTARLRDEVRSALAFVRDLMEALARRPEASAVYASAGSPLLRLVSPLAAGADRMVAEEALALGYSLYSPLPFAQAEYERDFGACVGEFRELASRAILFELDGARGEEENLSYEAVGQFVVRNCDLLVALWNGRPAAGRGGTAEIVRYAARAALPVWWINAERADEPPKLLLGLSNLRQPEHALAGEAARAELEARLRSLVAPSFAAPRPSGGAIAHAARRLAKAMGEPASPLHAYLAERRPPQTPVWAAYSLFLNLLAPAPAGTKMARMDRAITPVEKWWETQHRRADELSQSYADRYRSSYVLIALLALAAFVSSIVIGGSSRSPVIAVEWICLSCIAALAVMNHRRQWHERWISYRLLAELCRSELILAPIGRALPGSEVRRSSAEGAADPSEEVAAENWIGWHFQALQRAAPFPQGHAAESKMRAFALARSLIAEQEDYHRLRGWRAGQADRRLAAASEASFLLVLIAATCQFGLLLAGADVRIPWLSPLTGGLSVLSAALVGLRAYAEFGLLARQSQRQREGLQEIQAELGTIDVAEPLASQRLGPALHRLTLLMMQDMRGWAQIFRLKSVETS